MSVSWEFDFGIPSPSGPAMFYSAWRQSHIVNAAAFTAMELNYYRSLGFTERGARGALAVEWNAKGLRGTGSMGRDYVMYHSRSLVRGGIPIDQVILHPSGFRPGWLPRRMPRAQVLQRKLMARALPGVGWALLAYDAYDILVNRSIWGFSLD